MNKIYFVIVSDDWGGVYVSAPNEAIAREIAQTDPLIYEFLSCEENWDFFRCRYVKGTNLPTKVLNIEEIINEDCHWWSCDNEDCRNEGPFQYYGSHKYKCLKCGSVFDVPYPC